MNGKSPLQEQTAEADDSRVMRLWRVALLLNHILLCA